MFFTENTTIVLTGELSQCDREEFAGIIFSMGCAISGGINRRTSVLVVGSGAKETKIEKAKSLGIPIWTEQEFWAAVAAQYPPQK